MSSLKKLILSCTVVLVAVAMRAQNAAIVPQLINFSGSAINEQGKAVTGAVGVTFSIYNAQQGGSPLWMETQNVQTDLKGNYTVQLGATTSEGLPLNLFSSGEARWLGVRVSGAEEQSRVLLLSVPYALKAADAQTLGGLPPSAFVLATPSGNGMGLPSSATVANRTSAPTVGGSGTQDYIPLWTDNSGDLGNSILYQLGTGSSAKLGINLTDPLFTLDVNGSELVRGLFEMATTGFATPTKAYNSQPFNIESSAFNSGTNKYTLNHFQWQAEPTGNNSANTGATLNLLYGTDPASPTETGLSISPKGLFTFAPGQTFPGTGTITGVTAGTDLTGGGSNGSVTLNVDTTKVPQLNAANTFTGNQTVNGNLSATGTVSGASFQLGSNLFAFGSYGFENAFLGFAGNTTMTGGFNTASGAFAFISNTTGTDNTATGVDALYSNNAGSDNTANGVGALYSNTTGNSNTASGYGALLGNTTSNGNSAFGYQALSNSSTGLENTAVGYQALYSNTTLPFNTAVGGAALYSNANGYDNTAVGYDTLYYNNYGYQNTAIGLAALQDNTSGAANTASGYDALFSNTTGSENTAVGYGAAYTNTTGNDLTCVGYDCTVADHLTNATAIGAHAQVEQSNALVLGSAGINVGIGTTKPSNILTIGRGLGHPVSDSWETYSSRRWKTNIHPLQNALSKVQQLRGVSYDLKDSGKHEIGVIAEEVGQVVPEVVSYEKNGKDAQGVDYSRLTALLIEAVKQQQTLIRSQQKQIALQQAQIRNQQRLMKAQQRETAGLSHKVGMLESSLGPAHEPIATVLASR